MNAAAPTDWHTIKVVVPFLTEEQAELARTILSIDQEIKPYMIKRTLTAAGTSLQASFEALSIRQARVSLNHFLSDIELIVQTIDELGPSAGFRDAEEPDELFR